MPSASWQGRGLVEPERHIDRQTYIYRMITSDLDIGVRALLRPRQLVSGSNISDIYYIKQIL